MSNVITNRYEILFMYDIKDANPNGDPNDENKPRLDEETSHNIVTDVRLKRTIRDFLYEQGNEIFIREIADENDNIQDATLRATQYLPKDKLQAPLMERKKIISENVIKECIDVRLFGATIPLTGGKKKNKKEKDTGEEKEGKGKSITYTGPTQFKMGRSLHRVKSIFIKGTGAFASKQGNTQKTFREEYILPYSLIAFHGIVNENNAKHTQLGEDDLVKLKKAIWNGTKGLTSRSKFGQAPRLLLFVKYKMPHFFIGDLDHLVTMKTELREEEVRRPEEYQVDITKLVESLNKYADRIDSVQFACCERVTFVVKEKNDYKKVALNELAQFVDISNEVI